MAERVMKIPEMRGGECFPPYLEERRAVKALPFTAFADIEASPRKEWLMKGAVASGETSSVIGPPGSGKSAFVTDLTVHAAMCRDWRGFKAKRPALVVYIAQERGDLTKRRLEAYRRKFEIADIPFVVVVAGINLMSDDCARVLYRTYMAAQEYYYEKRVEFDGVIVVIDTFAKAIACGGGDENKAADQNRVLGHLRDFQKTCWAHIILIGHTGKNTELGARGSNAHVGDVDVMVQISGDKTKEATVIKANDQTEGRMATFKLETFEFGLDEDGDPITTSIVSSEMPMGGPEPAKGSTASPQQRVALEALDEAVGAHGQDVSALYQLPSGLKGVTFDQWREELTRRGVLRKDDKFLHQSFRKLRVAMDAKKLIGVRDELVWRACTR